MKCKRDDVSKRSTYQRKLSRMVQFSILLFLLNFLRVLTFSNLSFRANCLLLKLSVLFSKFTSRKPTSCFKNCAWKTLFCLLRGPGLADLLLASSLLLFPAEKEGLSHLGTILLLSLWILFPLKKNSNLI